MKVKEALEILNQCNPEAELEIVEPSTRLKDGYHSDIVAIESEHPMMVKIIAE